MQRCDPGTGSARLRLEYHRDVRIWVVILDIKEDVVAKICQKHKITEQQLRDEIVCVKGLRVTPRADPLRGFRYFVEFKLRGSDFVAVLRPHPYDNERFRLLTCYEMN